MKKILGEFYCEDNGRPGSAIRLMVSLHYLKFTFDLSDQQTLANRVENPYWQRFSGGIFFERKSPIDSSSMTKWRGRLKDAGLEDILAETLRAGLRSKLIRKSEL